MKMHHRPMRSVRGWRRPSAPSSHFTQRHSHKIKGIEECELEARNVKRRMEVKAECQKGKSEGKKNNINWYRKWGKRDRRVSYHLTKAVTHRNALVDLKKKLTWFQTGHRKEPGEGQSEIQSDNKKCSSDDLRGHIVALPWVVFGSKLHIRFKKKK